PAALTVNDNGDASDAAPGDRVCATAGGVCTLRAAIQEANALSSCGGTININFSLSTPNNINLNSALPNINHYVSINGPGANLMTVQRSTAGGTPNFRIFTINAGWLVGLSGLTITNGRAADGIPGTGFGGGRGGDGGGVFNQGSLVLTSVVITGNRTGDGGPDNSSFGGPGGFGGGVYSEGSLAMQGGVTVSN